jgi:hypothetical protein
VRKNARLTQITVKMCFSEAKTLCKGEVQATYEQKIGNYRECEFYKTLMADA